MTCGELKGPPICLEVEEKEKFTLYAHLSRFDREAKYLQYRKDETKEVLTSRKLK